MSKVVEIIEIGDFCIETFPCVHHVTIRLEDGTIESREMRGDYIYEILQETKKNDEIPRHFLEYKDYISTTW